MTKAENLMDTAMEECAEIQLELLEIQTVLAKTQMELSKSLRFGIDNHSPLTPEITNEDALLTEYYHLQAVMENLQDIGFLKRFDADKVQQIKSKKIAAVTKYQAVSVKLGTIME